MAEHVSSMKGGNFYNKHSSWQQHALEPAEEYILQAVKGLPRPTGPTYQVADLGCSQGANSQRPVSLVIDTIREQGAAPNHPISIFHVDLPSNDFNSLFGVLVSDKSYRIGRENVFSFAEGKSFHEPLFPPESFHLIMTFCALHWLSKKPANESVTFSSTGETAADKDRLAFSAQAREDLVRYFRNRAAELVKGGKLVVSYVSSTDTMKVKSDIIEYGSQALQTLLESGNITLQEARDCISCIHYRSVSETQESIEAVSDVLKLEALKQQDIQHPKYKLFQNGEVGIDEYAQNCRDFMKAIFEPSLLHSLDPKRSGEERQLISDQIFELIRQKVVQAPIDCHFPCTYFFLTRI